MQKIEDKRVYMNTEVKITVYSDTGTIDTFEAISKAFSKFDYVMKNFTRFDNSSELSELNQHQGRSFSVTPELFELVDFAFKLAKKTNGRFDPTIIDMLEMYGYKADKTFSELDDKELFQNVKERMRIRPSYYDIRLERKTRTITLARNQRLDLGSLGKGYAINLAKKELDIFPAFLIEAGGDIYAKGSKPDGKGWQVGLAISDGSEKEPFLGTLQLENQSLCSSGNWANKYRFFHHLINTASGLPENMTKQVFVLGKDPFETDAWATAFFLMGPDGLPILEAEGLSGLIIDKNDIILKSKNFNYKKNT